MNAKQEFLRAVLKEGEQYAGIILGKNGDPDYHLILLLGQATDVNLDKAKKFAAEAGGDLPTRREQSLLYANLKEEFDERGYWSNTLHASNESYAWCQSFSIGGQYDVLIYVSNELRARAVRRIVIE